MFFQRNDKQHIPTVDDALPGRSAAMAIAPTHLVTGSPMRAPWPGMETAVFGMGCFWGAERRYWQQPGVMCTAAGYAGGHTPNPTYAEVCSGRTGHTEVVLVVYDRSKTSYDELLRIFFESHDPTQGMRQGNDVGTQYRSAVYWMTDAQRARALAVRDSYQEALRASSRGEITSELAPAAAFYYAEDEHQQYLHKNPRGYCGLRGTGVTCAIDASVRA